MKSAPFALSGSLNPSVCCADTSPFRGGGMRGEVRHKKPRLAACTCLLGRAPLPPSGGNCPRGLPAPFQGRQDVGRGCVTEAANSGVNFTCWGSSAAALRRKLEAGTARPPEGKWPSALPTRFLSGETGSADRKPPRVQGLFSLFIFGLQRMKKNADKFFLHCLSPHFSYFAQS